MKYKAIIFDFYGVISSRSVSVWIENIFKNKINFDLKEIRKRYILDVDKGDISDEDRFEGLGKLAGYPADDVRRECYRLAGVDVKVTDIIEKLKNDYKIILLSNASGTFLRKFIKDNGLYPLFDEVVISSEIRMIKPDKDIYEFALNKINLMPGEVVFIDDTLENVEAAKSLGITGLLFKNADVLKEDLKKIGVLI